MNVVVVESPAKAKTINKYLGSGYTVLASFGHVRDLPPKDGSVRPDEDFAMSWEVEGKAETRIKAIAQALKSADRLILATDPDREGEAISWHIAEELARRKALTGKQVARVVFNEITRSAVLDAMQHPRDGLAAQRPAPAQFLADMPGDGLALAVRVGGEDQLVSGFESLGDGLDPLLGLALDFPAHGEVFLGLDRAVLGRQVADMAEARQDRVVRTEVFIDGLRLGGRFDDDDVHRAAVLS